MGLQGSHGLLREFHSRVIGSGHQFDDRMDTVPRQGLREVEHGLNCIEQRAIPVVL